MIAAEMTFTSVRGHMMDMEFPEEYRWGRCHPGTLFRAPVITKISQEANTIAQNLATEVRHSDMLIIWTDCDREGEHIGHEVARHCQAKKRGLIVKRARFSAVISECVNLLTSVKFIVHA